MKKLTFLFLLLMSSAVATAELNASAHSLRPAGAPHLSIPHLEKIDRSLKEKGSAKIIVRLAPPVELNGTFQLDAELKEKAAAGRQRTAIAAAQHRVLARLSRKNAASAKKFDFIPYMALDVDPADFETLAGSAEIDAIEEDIPVPPALAQSVPLIGGDAGGMFNGYTGTGQVVAILDTGVDKNHPFLSGKVVAEACYSTTYTPDGSTAVCTRGSTAPGSGANCSSAVEGCDHGTHVAGIAAGKGPTFSGVAKDAGIVAVQVFSQFPVSACGVGATGPCVMSYTSDQISALQYVYSLRGTYSISSVNMSLGGGSYGSYCDASQASLKAAVDNLRAAGIATVIASGNEGYAASISAPACISTAISVGATTKSDYVASYSNSASILTLLAPGSAISSSVPGSGYASWDGTSMATPHVAGAWAILKSVKPAATVDEILTALLNSGTSITDIRNGLVKRRIEVDTAASILGNVTGHPLTVTKTGAGSGTVSGSMGIYCGTSCTASVPEGTTVTLTATPAGSSAFAGWSGACSGTASTCTFTMNGSKTVQAEFIATTSVGSESFSSGASPAAWTVSGTSAGWRFDDPARRGNQTGGSGGFAVVDSDYAGRVTMDTVLKSPIYDLTSFTKAYLSFRTYFRYYSDEICDVDLSTDGGATWNNVWRKSGADHGPSAEKLDISALAAGRQYVAVRFRYYNARYDWYWQIDDFALSGVRSTATYTVTGTVTGSNGSIASASPVTVTSGTSATFAVSPAAGHKPGDVGGTCPAGSFTGNSYTTGTISADCYVNFSFTPLTFTIGTATSGNGTITCTPWTLVTYSTPAACTAIPGSGNFLAAVTVDGVPRTVSERTSFTHSFGPITSDHSVSATFAAIVPPPPPQISSATAGNQTATVSFTAPSDDGGSTITGYTVTAAPGNITATGTGSPITVTGLSNGTSYTFTVTATNAAGSSQPSSPSDSVTPVRYDTLNVTPSGTGTGRVDSNPAGIACISGSSAGCSASFSDTATVSLQAVPSWDADFAGWSGDCSGTGTCTVSMGAARNVSAAFVRKETVSVAETMQRYSTLQSAYNALGNDSTIRLQASTFHEDIVLDKPITTVLEGGKDGSFLTDIGFTTINGSLTIAGGTALISNIIIR
ncbi:S8 family serine peptidase [Geobacter sp. DSM 9736]|uniref:S8 family serine peptidase n=1 Tax=Geobacter sp. DSM 9736 TaxID=1277350 RepID=UPI000B5E8306|nr:S8 family serine peptidase [Geobacter sp. DSM 9736]SNB44915.1 Serine protease, subtilisin family [Geobacter sp. DSM 9736]